MSLPNHFYTMPAVASDVFDREELRAILKETGGSVMALGGLWDIKTKHMGAGMYRVTLKRRTYDEVTP